MINKILNTSSFLISASLIVAAVTMWLPQEVFNATDTRQNNQQSNLAPEVLQPKFVTLAERPIFQKKRRFKAIVEEEPEEEKPHIPEIPLVKGLAIAEPGNRFVFIQSSKDGVVYQLRKGQLLDGKWEVLEINLSEILLVDKDGHEIVLDVGA